MYIVNMRFSVVYKRKIEKEINFLPQNIRERFFELVNDLKNDGPFQHKWPNYSPLRDEKYHCHLSYSWVACWKQDKETITIEVYYVGSREKAPY
jgi:mRNA-degrading endonuclease RelE of RelBE toxin-antitoxin system